VSGAISFEAAGWRCRNLAIDVTKRLDLDVSFVWDRIGNPKASADGTQPKVSPDRQRED
jgi:hypothetical protein